MKSFLAVVGLILCVVAEPASAEDVFRSVAVEPRIVSVPTGMFRLSCDAVVPASELRGHELDLPAFAKRKDLHCVLIAVDAMSISGYRVVERSSDGRERECFIPGEAYPGFGGCGR